MENNFTFNRRLAFILSLVSITLIVIGIIIKFWHWDFDDSYIAYRYAENIINGNGWCFNPGECYNASTSVLNTLLIAIFSLITHDPRISAHILGGLSIFAAGMFCFLIFRKKIDDSYAAIVSIIIVMVLGYNNTWGLEIYLFSALCLLFVLLEVEGINTWYLLGFIILARPDGAVIFLSKTAVDIVKKKKIPIKGILQFSVVVLPWFLFSLYRFHQIFPATLSQKMWQGRSGFWGHGLVYLRYIHHLLATSTFMYGFSIVPAIFGLVIMLKKKSPFLYLVFFVIIQQVVYILLNVPDYPWYVSFFSLVFLLSSAYGFKTYFLSVSSGLYPFWPNWKTTNLSWHKSDVALILAILITAFSLNQFFILIKHPETDVRDKAYRTLAREINSKIPEGSIAALETGTIAYYTKRKILDITGLTSPQGEFMTGRNNDIFFKIRPKIVIMHSDKSNSVNAMEANVYNDPRFKFSYRLMDTVKYHGYAPLLVYVSNSQLKD